MTLQLGNNINKHLAWFLTDKSWNLNRLLKSSYASCTTLACLANQRDRHAGSSTLKESDDVIGAVLSLHW